MAFWLVLVCFILRRSVKKKKKLGWRHEGDVKPSSFTWGFPGSLRGQGGNIAGFYKRMTGPDTGSQRIYAWLALCSSFVQLVASPLRDQCQLKHADFYKQWAGQWPRAVTGSSRAPYFCCTSSLSAAARLLLWLCSLSQRELKWQQYKASPNTACSLKTKTG